MYYSVSMEVLLLFVDDVIRLDNLIAVGCVLRLGVGYQRPQYSQKRSLAFLTIADIHDSKF